MPWALAEAGADVVPASRREKQVAHAAREIDHEGLCATRCVRDLHDERAHCLVSQRNGTLSDFFLATRKMEIEGAARRAACRQDVVQRFPSITGDAVVADLGQAATRLDTRSPGLGTPDDWRSQMSR